MSKNIVSIDRYLYERILFNLLSNAVKFTSSGGKISVSIAVEGERLRVKVQDTGIGIPGPDIGRLFQKFRQVDSSSTRRFEGAGLGLALVKEFSQLLGGDVSVESKPGKGSVFTVECLAPRTEASPATSEIPHPSVPVRLVEQYGYSFQSEERKKKEGQRKLLIAEDNLELAHYMADLLGNLWQVKIVRDGNEALQIVREWTPDLVISDVMMPNRDGLSFCKEMKAVPETRDIPIILLTALTYREALLRGWEAGADDYLFKPFHPKELLVRVRSFLVFLELTAERKRAEEAVREKVRELAVMNKAMMDREARILGLKEEVRVLHEQQEKNKFS